VALDAEFEASVADVFFEREVAKVAVVVEGAGAALAELDGVVAGFEGVAGETSLLSKEKRFSALTATSCRFWPSIQTSIVMSGCLRRWL